MQITLIWKSLETALINYFKLCNFGFGLVDSTKLKTTL